jgi:Na+-driven multidrug efflux pump
MGHVGAGVVVSEALALAACACIAIAAVLLCGGAHGILRAMGDLPAPMVATASSYLTICALGLPFAVSNAVMQACALRPQ